MQIEVSFNVWKALTALLVDENDTYSAAVERLLQGQGLGAQNATLGGQLHGEKRLQAGAGAFFKDVFLPNGTELRATYKGKTYFSRISESEWIDEISGESRSSPSQAAYSITGRNVNGWLFWLVKRPGDHDWRSLNSLRVYDPKDDL